MSLWQWLFGGPQCKPTAPPFRPSVEGLEEREVLSTAGLPGLTHGVAKSLSAQQVLLNSLNNLPPETRSRLAAAWENIVRGSTRHHHIRIPGRRPHRPRLPMNRPPRVITPEYLLPQGYDPWSWGNEGGSTYEPHDGYDDNAYWGY